MRSSMFGLENAFRVINQIRNMLDLLEAKLLFPVLRKWFSALEESGELEAFRSYRKQLLIILDGTPILLVRRDPLRELFASYEGEQTTYFHTVITPVIAPQEMPG